MWIRTSDPHRSWEVMSIEGPLIPACMEGIIIDHSILLARHLLYMFIWNSFYALQLWIVGISGVRCISVNVFSGTCTPTCTLWPCGPAQKPQRAAGTTPPLWFPSAAPRILRSPVRQLPGALSRLLATYTPLARTTARTSMCWRAKASTELSGPASAATPAQQRNPRRTAGERLLVLHQRRQQPWHLAIRWECFCCLLLCFGSW